MQCLRRYKDTGRRHPNLPNAFKYALSMIVTCIGVFHHERLEGSNPIRVIWIVAYVASSIYSWYWDVFMDWSLIDVNSSDYIRPRRMLSKRFFWIYYVIVPLDFILRFFWAHTLIVDNREANFSLLGFVARWSALAEIIRRAIWAIFRYVLKIVKLQCIGL